MARMSDKEAQAERAAADSWGQRIVLESGYYLAKLDEVDDTPVGPKGPYWKWIFKYEDVPGKAFLNTSLSDSARGSRGAVFKAFDADPSSDTDELLGELCVLYISKGKIQGGKRMGEWGNNIDAVLPATDENIEQCTRSAEGAERIENEAPNGDAPATAAKKAGGGRRRRGAETAANDWD